MTRSRISRPSASAVLAALSLWTVGARADEPDLGPDAAASALFEEGRALVEAGEWEAGCDKLEQSMQRYAAASTMLNLARCAEHSGKVATAWARYKRGLVLTRETPGEARREALARVAEQGIAALEPRLPRLVVSVQTKAGEGAPAGIRVEEDGRPLALDTAVVLDPGTLTIVATAPGFEPVERVVELVEGEVTEAQLVLVASPVPPPPVGKVGPPTPPSQPDAPAEPASANGGAPWWTWASGGLGIALAGASVGFAIDALSVAGSLEDRCGDDLVCDEDPSFDPGPDNARKTRDIALSIAFGAGAAAALGTAAIGLVMGSSGGTAARPLPNVRFHAGPGGAGLIWAASF
jgi:hypothetical protein